MRTPCRKIALGTIKELDRLAQAQTAVEGDEEYVQSRGKNLDAEIPSAFIFT